MICGLHRDEVLGLWERYWINQKNNDWRVELILGLGKRVCKVPGTFGKFAGHPRVQFDP